MKLTREAALRVIMLTGWPKDQWAVALAVAEAESGLDTSAVSPPNSNGTRDRGLFQINDVHKLNHALLLTPHYNSQQAARIYRRDGWQAWSAYKNKRYENFLPEAASVVKKVAGISLPSAIAKDLGSVAGKVAGSLLPENVDKLLKNLQDRAVWIRVAQVAGGSVLVIVGLVILSRDLARDAVTGALSGAVGGPVGAAVGTVTGSTVGGAAAAGATGSVASRPAAKVAKKAVK